MHDHSSVNCCNYGHVNNHITGYLGKDAPSIEDLGMVKNQARKTYKLMDEVQNQWKDIGIVLGVKIDNIRDQPGTGPVREVFNKWIKDASSLPNSKFFPKSWDGLREILKDSGLAEIGKSYFAFLETCEN